MSSCEGELASWFIMVSACYSGTLLGGLTLWFFAHLGTKGWKVAVGLAGIFSAVGTLMLMGRI